MFHNSEILPNPVSCILIEVFRRNTKMHLFFQEFASLQESRLYVYMIPIFACLSTSDWITIEEFPITK